MLRGNASHPRCRAHIYDRNDCCKCVHKHGTVDGLLFGQCPGSFWGMGHLNTIFRISMAVIKVSQRVRQCEPRRTNSIRENALIIKDRLRPIHQSVNIIWRWKLRGTSILYTILPKVFISIATHVKGKGRNKASSRAKHRTSGQQTLLDTERDGHSQLTNRVRCDLNLPPGMYKTPLPFRTACSGG